MGHRKLNNENCSIRLMHICNSLKIKTVYALNKRRDDFIIGSHIAGKFLISQDLIDEIDALINETDERKSESLASVANDSKM